MNISEPFQDFVDQSKMGKIFLVRIEKAVSYTHLQDSLKAIMPMQEIRIIYGNDTSYNS